MKCDVYAICYDCKWREKISDNIDDSEITKELLDVDCKECKGKAELTLTHPGEIPSWKLPVSMVEIEPPESGETKTLIFEEI